MSSASEFSLARTLSWRFLDTVVGSGAWWGALYDDTTKQNDTLFWAAAPKVSITYDFTPIL